MTEAKWLACTDPQQMLAFLRGKVSESTFRVFTVRCCRTIWPLLTARDSRLLQHERRIVSAAEQSLVIAEQYVDGLLERTALDRAYCDIIRVLSMRRPEHEPWAFVLVAILRAVSTGRCYYGQQWEYDQYDAYRCAGDVANYIARIAAWVSKAGDDFEAMLRVEAALCRCIFSNPFRSITISSSWLTPTVKALIRSIYEESNFDLLPILADALDDAGCNDADVLIHCRQPGPDARGCWLVDLILAKE